MLELQNITKLRHERLVFAPLSCVVDCGEIVHLTGENGIGKSTLINILAGFLSFRGSMRWQKTATSNTSASYLNDISYFGQFSCGVPNLTVGEHFSLYRNLQNRDDAPRLAWQEILIDMLQIKPLWHCLYANLSSGQKSRLLLALTLLKKSHLWLLDEPWNSLDAHMSSCLWELISLHTNVKGSVIFVSHTQNLNNSSCREVAMQSASDLDNISAVDPYVA